MKSKRNLVLCMFVLQIFAQLSFSQQAEKNALEKGINFIATQTYSEKENIRLLGLYKNLRVADVSDAMDMVGLAGAGLVDPQIHPLWIDTDSLRHCFRGIALTVRYVPTQQPNGPKPGEDFETWMGRLYTETTSEAFEECIKPGHAIVIDDVEEKDIGSIGSNNILIWHQKGAVGVVTDAGARDTDEVAKEKVPLYLRRLGRGIRPGRNELESVNRPISLGGVLICPGDVVVADKDGVVVVPRKVAETVAIKARDVLENDKSARRSLYKSLGMPLDQTVQ